MPDLAAKSVHVKRRSQARLAQLFFFPNSDLSRSRGRLKKEDFLLFSLVSDQLCYLWKELPAAFKVRSRGFFWLEVRTFLGPATFFPMELPDKDGLLSNFN